MKKLIIIGICVVLVGAVGLRIIPQLLQNAAVPTSAPAEEAIVVSTQSPQIGNLTVSTEFIGKVQPDEQVNIYPKMSGTVLATHFEVGQQVHKGDLLFEIDPSDIEAQLAVAQAGYNVAKASVDSTLGSGIDLQLLQTDSSVRNAQNSFSNANKAFNDYIDDYDPDLEKLEETRDELRDSRNEAEKGVSAAQTAYNNAQKALKDHISIGYSEGNEAWYNHQYELLKDNVEKAEAALKEAQTAYSSVNAAYEQAKTAYDSMKDGYDTNFDQLRSAMKAANIALDTAQQTQDITYDKAVPEIQAAANAQLASAQAQLDASMKQLEYTKVTSPIDGVIELKNVEEHGLVSQQSPAYIVSNKDIMVVKFGVPSSAAQAMSVGDTLTIENGSAVYTGSVIEIGSMVDEQSGLFPVKARIDAESGTLLNGISVKVTASTAKAEDALLIPINSVYHDDDETAYVYVVSDTGTAVKTPVETGITDDEQIEILSGIAPDSKIITSWNPNLLDGVKVSEASAASQSAGSSQPQDSTSNSSEASSSSQEG